jgi:hypothetical protein
MENLPPTVENQRLMKSKRKTKEFSFGLMLKSFRELFPAAAWIFPSTAMQG